MSNIHDLKQIDVCGVNISKQPQIDDIQVNFEHGKGKIKGRQIFTLIDNSNECINVNLWGELSKKIIKEGDIIVINGARVTNYGGKNLNCSPEHAKVFVNPGPDIVDNIKSLVDTKKGQ
jgi:hypothetical protein